MKGIDIYSGTNITNWEQIKASGVEAVYIKATDGKTYTNPKLDEQYKGAKSVGMLVGMYHFAENNSVQDEYNNYINVTNKYELDLKPCLDYEAKAENIPFINTFMALNDKLILYASHSMADKTGLPLNRIWIAEPNIVPNDTRGYAGIQYNWHGRTNGTTGDSDIDLFSNDILNVINVVTLGNIVGSVNSMAIKLGEKSPRVKLLQSILSVLICNIAVDGDFGNGTLVAVKKYQSIMGLTVDGIVGSNTITTLMADLKNNWFKL